MSGTPAVFLRPPDTFLATSAIALTIILFLAILTAFSPEFWPVSLLQVGMFALAGIWTIRMLVRPFRLQFDALLIPFSGTALWGLIQLFANTTIYRFATWLSVLNWLTVLLAFFLALQIFESPGLRRRFLQAAVYFGFGLSIISITQYFTAPAKAYWLFRVPYRSTLGPFVYENQYAAFIELILPAALYLGIADRRRWLFYFAAAAAMFATVVASSSRGGTVLVAGEIVAFFVMAHAQGRLTLGLRTLLFVVLCITFSAVVGWEATWTRMREHHPFEMRREFLVSSWAMLKERPWMGFGLGNWRTAYPAYAVVDTGLFANQAHNDWVEWAVEGGLPFFALLLWIAAASALPAWRSLWGLGIATVFIHCLIDYPAREPSLAVLLFTLLGAAIHSSRQRSPAAREHTGGHQSAS